MDLTFVNRSALLPRAVGVIVGWAYLAAGGMAAQAGAPAIVVHPDLVTLDGGFQRCQLLVRPLTPDGTAAETVDDLTGLARFSSKTPDVATVSATGVVSAVGNGSARIEVSLGDARATVEVVVSGSVEAARADFERDVLPVLTRAGCNAGTCHASQYGKGGFAPGNSGNA